MKIRTKLEIGKANRRDSKKKKNKERRKNHRVKHN
jgi:hypothetical protein